MPGMDGAVVVIATVAWVAFISVVSVPCCFGDGGGRESKRSTVDVEGCVCVSI